MKVYEFGKEKENTVLMFQCAAEPWWAFEKSAEALAQDFHVYLFISDGHDELGTDFISIEKNVEEAVSCLKERGIKELDLLYGVSMGGASAMYLLANRLFLVKKAIIDAGITPYSYPKLLCRLVAIKDFFMIKAGFSSVGAMKKVMPPERWTPEGEDPAEHYKKIYDYGKKHFSNRTIYNVFWSANNYPMPDPVPEVTTEMEYWYGEEERAARKADISYAKKSFPQCSVSRWSPLCKHHGSGT